VTLVRPAANVRHLAVKVRRPGERRSLSRSATRALDVLELFGEVRRPLRAVEIARDLEIHASTANQLLKTMVGSAHLVFDARDKTYLPSPRLVGFGSWIVELYGASGRLHELVAELQVRTRMVATVSVPNDLDMQVIDLAVPEGQGGERGLRISLFGSAVGSACLAMLGDDEITRLAHRARIPPVQVPAVFAEVAQLRAHGYADGPLEGSPYWSLAMPLPVRGWQLPSVLGLAGPADQVRSQVDDLSQVMREVIAWWNDRPASDR
jgi:DNA-binding IclR family transcriptional regulator